MKFINEISGKIENKIKYKVKDLSLDEYNSEVYGIMEIKGKKEDFSIDFTNSAETEYDFLDKEVKDEFKEALDDFYNNHIVEQKANKIKNNNMIIERTISFI